MKELERERDNDGESGREGGKEKDREIERERARASMRCRRCNYVLGCYCSQWLWRSDATRKITRPPPLSQHPQRIPHSSRFHSTHLANDSVGVSSNVNSQLKFRNSTCFSLCRHLPGERFKKFKVLLQPKKDCCLLLLLKIPVDATAVIRASNSPILKVCRFFQTSFALENCPLRSQQSHQALWWHHP